MKNDSNSLEVAKLKEQEQFYKKKFEELVLSPLENRGFLHDLDLRSRFLRRGHFCRFCYVILEKYPELRGDIVSIYKNLAPKGGFTNINQFPNSGITEEEVLQLKEAVKIEDFINKLERIESVKIEGKFLQGGETKKLSATITLDSMLLGELKDFLKAFWANWRGYAQQEFLEVISHTGKPKDFDKMRRNEFAIKCYNIIAHNSELSSKRQKAVFVYYILYLFNYIPLEEHLRRQSELYPDNSYGSFVEAILEINK